MNLVYHSPQNPNSHCTVRDRVGPSLPLRMLLSSGLITGRVLDFGCGLGQDVQFLRSQGIDATGYDPYYAPEIPVGKFDTILCLYVLNVLLPEEQAHVLMAVSEFLKESGHAYFAVRRDIAKDGFRVHVKHHTQVYQCTVRLPYESKFRTEHSEIYEYRHYNQQVHLDHQCRFCCPGPEECLITESATAYALRNTDANLPGHVFIIPKKHIADYFDLSPHARTACWLMVERVRMLLIEQFQPTGVEVRLLMSGVSGELVDHIHFDLVPHYAS